MLFSGLMVPPAFASASSLKVVVPATQTPQEQAATTMFVEETARRTSAVSTATEVAAGPLTTLAAGRQVLLLAPRTGVEPLLPKPLVPAWQAALRAAHPGDRAEGFTVAMLPWRGGSVTVVAGDDVRGELFGAGWLLRHMTFAGNTPRIVPFAPLYTAPEKPVRGHQIGYRFKNNTYDAWTLEQFEQGIRDLAIFGTNTIQLIAPVSDDAPSSPLFPAPALETVLGISKILAKYGLDCDLYYPEVRKDYTDPATVAAELKDFEELVRAMPRLDSLHVPGGDPGHTSPAILFPLLAREAEILHRYHPGAPIWVSAQGFDAERYASFYALLDRQPAWLTGVFFGPQSRESFPAQRSRIPARYAMQFYPDIGHTMHAQFPVPRWDPIFALTESREPICPRPVAFRAIYERFAPLHTGFLTYSEGMNDDVNKIVWSQLGWSSKLTVDTILGEFAGFMLHREGTQRTLAVQALRGLEENWQGPLAANRSIPRTLAAVEMLERNATPLQTAKNGAWESLLYRATYDDYLQRKLARERQAEAVALTLLDTAAPAAERVAAAHKALAATTAGAEERREHERLFSLASELFHDAGLQLSVKLYGASGWERGANLDRVDTPLTDAAWLESAMAAALKLPDEAQRLAALHGIAYWSRPTPDALYDDLGDPANEPHLVRGEGWAADPELYRTAIDSIADRTLAANPAPDGAPGPGTPWRLSWLDYAETLYETPLELRYRGLDPRRSYRVRVTYAGEDYALPLRLTANGKEVHPARLRTANPETVDFPTAILPKPDGTLSLRWTGPEGTGGGGRGRQVAEVWLLPQSPNK